MIFVPYFGHLRVLNIAGLVTVGVTAIYIICDCINHGLNSKSVQM